MIRPRIALAVPLLALPLSAFAQTTETAPAPATARGLSSAPAAAAPAAGTRPVAAPAPAPAAAPLKADYATPAGTVRTFVAASRAGDVKAMLACYAVDKGDAALLTPSLELTAASARWYAAVKERFDPSDLARAKIKAPYDGADVARGVPAAPEGDTVTVPLAGGSAVLRRVDNAWKLDPAGVPAIATDEARARTKALLPVVTAAARATDEVTAEVAAGKYGAAAAAQRALQERVIAATKAAQ